jgi:molybdopterin molybdotransferase
VRDITSAAIGTLGRPGLLAHGVNIRPGKPTILAICSGKPVIGLPGNPVSAYITANLFIAPLVKFLLGEKEKRFLPAVQADLSSNIPSQAGREDWIPIKLSQSNNTKIATPIFAKSNYIFSLVSADGLICIKPEQTGLEAGEIVEVYLCD